MQPVSSNFALETKSVKRGRIFLSGKAETERLVNFRREQFPIRKIRRVARLSCKKLFPRFWFQKRENKLGENYQIFIPLGTNLFIL